MEMENIIVKVGRRIYNKLYPHNRTRPVTDNYFGIPVASIEKGNQLIADHIKSGKPFMLSRLGHAELQCLTNYSEINFLKSKNPILKTFYQIKGYNNDWLENVRIAMKRNTGYFPTEDEDLQKFAAYYFECIKNIDILAVWYNYFEDEIVRRYCPDASLMPLASIEPYYFNNPWSMWLKGKKVLVIHPFEKSIQKQFLVKDKLFKNIEMLPDFLLTTIKAVQSNAYNETNYTTWFEALESMKQKMQQADFDIALIGAGAYGLPLAAYAKELGKQAIHFGGSLQILFGIKGARWDIMPSITEMYNEYWIRPLKEETPDGFKKVEDGCYW